MDKIAEFVFLSRGMVLRAFANVVTADGQSNSDPLLVRPMWAFRLNLEEGGGTLPVV
ncbi:hypothetical protein [Pseudodesulfovibrio sediminis]|uniref:hypothetical protein n=1 Tax=Pseudodesulfovibrio sediminis TaxID=2810563 RepID=UPI001E43D942|nr:hypothetical protein [Pseudodesulfovibrio sediminis]